jgi:hypothetical protein
MPFMAHRSLPGPGPEIGLDVSRLVTVSHLSWLRVASAMRAARVGLRIAVFISTSPSGL